MINYELWLLDDGARDVRLELIDNAARIEYVKVVGDVGWLAVWLPYDTSKVYNSIRPDHRLALWRQPYDGGLELETIAFARRWAYETNDAGLTTLRLSGPDLNDLLRRRIVAYNAESAEAAMTDEADDMMRAVVVDNLGSDAATARQFSITVGEEQSAGPSITKAFSRQNVLSVLQGIQAASLAEDDECFFAIVPLSPYDYQFNTYNTQPGADRTAGGRRPLFFGLEYGNIVSPFYEQDYSDEVTFVYAGGMGRASDRNVQTAEDATRSNRSEWGRIEAFTSAINATTDNGVTAAAKDRLEKGRPSIKFSAQLLSTPQTPYGGSGWRVGDRVTVDHLKRRFTCLVRAVHVIVDGDGRERIIAHAEYRGDGSEGGVLA